MVKYIKILINTAVFKNIAGSAIIKLLSAVISFVIIPMILSVLGKYDYAIWAISTSLLSWIILFDFGIGYSLKNKVSEYLILKQWNNLYETVAATIQFLTLTTIVIFICFLFAFLFVDIFREQPVLILILYLPFILSFPSISGGFILQGEGRFNFFNLIQIIQPLLWFIIIFLSYINYIKANLLLFAIIYSISTLVMRIIIITCALRSIRFPMHFLRNYRLISFCFKTVVATGFKFFILQMCTLVLYSMGNILVSENLTLEQVAQYDVINKSFLFLMIFFNLVTAVFWTEISKAKAAMDISKLKKLHKSLYLISILCSLVSVCTIYVFPYFIPFWTKGMITVSVIQVLPFVGLTIIQFLGYTGAIFLNAFEVLKGQIILGILAAILMIPVTKIFFKMDLDIVSVPMSSAILTIPTIIYNYLISKKCIKTLVC